MIVVIILFCIVMAVLTFQRSNRKKREAYKYATESVDHGVTTLQTTVSDSQTDTPDIIKAGGNKVMVKRSYLDRFIRGAIISEELLWADEDSTGYVTTAVEELERMENRLAEYETRNRALTRCAELNNEGMRLEKQGDVDAAIAIYEQNISGDCYPATHSFDRLMILYRKRKDYQNERRVIQKAIRIFPKIDKYSKRLNTVNAILNKNKGMRKALLILFATVLLAACDSEPKSVSEGRELYHLYFQKTLRDPESLKIYCEKYEVDGDGIKVSWTIDYGAKNGYGAMDRATKEFMTIGDMLFVDNHYISKERLQQ